MLSLLGLLWGLVFSGGMIVLFLLPIWQLWKRTGHNPWYSLLMLVPFANFISLYVLAFKAWPIDVRQG